MEDGTEYNPPDFAKKKKDLAQRAPFYIHSIQNTLTLSQRGEKTDGLTLVNATIGILCCAVYGRGFCGAGETFGRYCCDVYR